MFFDKENEDVLKTLPKGNIQEFGRIMKQISDTNVFPHVLDKHGYTRIGRLGYRRDDNQLIHLYMDHGKWQYINLKNKEDRGSLIQFIANRLMTEKVVICHDPATIYRASEVAKVYLKQYKKELKSAYLSEAQRQAPSGSQKQKKVNM